MNVCVVKDREAAGMSLHSGLERVLSLKHSMVGSCGVSPRRIAVADP